MEEKRKKLEWEESYSVQVKEIDDQHKKLFATINELIDSIYEQTTKEHLNGIIDSLIIYKRFHFATEVRYFKEFNYSGAQDHINKHNMFNEKLDAIQKEFGADTVTFAFKLVDFLEDWLIQHLMTVDQQYVPCFKEHGLK